MGMRYQVGGKVTIDGVEYEIDEVRMDAVHENGMIQVSYAVRTRPNPEVIEFTVTTPGRESCGDAWEDDDSFGIGHECRLPKGHSGDHVCAYQDDDEDYCRWTNYR
jgi:hypothetical protein